MSADLFGSVETPPRVFKDIRNQRESVAEEKARLSLELHELLKRTPRFLSTASVQQVRQWKHAHTQAKKIAGAKESSRTELQTAINSMQGFE